MGLDITEIRPQNDEAAEDSFERTIETRLADLEPGRYRQNTAFVLRQFAEFIRRHNRIENSDVEAITPRTLRTYARALKRAVEQDKITASTAEQYWAVVSSFLGWSVREGLRESNPALLNEAQEPLPESDGGASRQFWTPRERTAICATADAYVDERLTDETTEQDLLHSFRDRALVYTLAYTGCRGAELLSVPADDKRDGLTWNDVYLEEGVLEVYGKTRKRQTAPILEPAVDPLRRWKKTLEPSENWPVFPTGHLPTLYDRLPDGQEPDHERIWRQLQGCGDTPPSMSTRSLRRVLSRLCEESAYEFDEVLTPHGARRGLGDELYQEDAELAQETLRHKNIETTHEAYRDERTRRVKERADEIIE